MKIFSYLCIDPRLNPIFRHHIQPMKRHLVRRHSLGLLFLLFSVFVGSSHAQTYTAGPEQFMTWDEFITSYIDENSQDAESLENTSQWNVLLDRLEELHNAPFNINTARREDFRRLPFLTDAQTDSILAYRSQKRLFYSLGELQWVSNLSYDTRRILSLFTYAGDTVPPSRRLTRKHLLQGQHSLNARADLPLYRRAGFRKHSGQDLQEHPSRYYLGPKVGHTLRYRYRWKKEIAYGVTLQNDAGEPFAAYRNYPYDYVSAYCQYAPGHSSFSLWLGDFNVHLGEGLLLGEPQFYGNAQLIEGHSPRHNPIRPHTSSDEYHFFRGAAGQIRIGTRWQCLAFVSFRKLDGSTANDTVSAIHTDGLHRTLTDLEHRRTLSNTVFGGRIAYHAHNWHLGANGYASLYGKTIWPPYRYYNRFYLRGKSATGISTDYAWRSRRWNLKGETAMDGNGHLATTNTLNYSPNGHDSYLLQQRCLHKAFLSPLGSTLQEAAHVQNEIGVMAGTVIHPFRRTSITAYIDIFRHPSPTFSARKPSKGVSGFLMASCTLSSRLRISVRHKVKAKQNNVTGHPGVLQYVTTHRSRVQAEYRTPRFSFHTAADFSAVARQTSPTTWGWMCSARSRYQCSKPFTLHIFGAVFFTDDYASRLYAYEPQLPSAAGFPTFAYHGIRLCGTAQWKFHSRGYAGIRYGWLHYFNRDAISSGAQQISDSSQNDLSLQIAWTF